MGQQIIQQPDNNYCIWSTIVDDFIIEDLTEQELFDLYKEERGTIGLAYAQKTVQFLKEGRKPYYQFTKTYEQACALRDELRPYHTGEN